MRSIAAAATLVIILAFHADNAFLAQDKKPAAPAQEASKQQEEVRPADKDAKDPIDAFAEWAKSIEPGPHHKHLERLVGKWTLAIKFIEPDGKTTDVAGTSEFKAILGGRYVAEETHTTMDGKPFDWFGWHGYDNVEKKHVADFIDNYGTNIDRMEGTCDKDCKEIAYVGIEKLAGGGEVKMRWVVKFESADKVVNELYTDAGEGEKKSLEIVAARAK